MTSNERELLRGTAGDLGVDLNNFQLDQLLVYLDELCLWNRRTNLTGLRSRKRMVVELLADSLVPAPFLPAGGRLLDVGSGAGLPGFPLKIARPDLWVDLLEPSQKRYHFLKQAIRLSNMDRIRALRGRVETSRDLLLQGYDVVAARAVAGLERTVELCAPLVIPEGRLVGFAGRNADADLGQARASLTKAGLSLVQDLPYHLPGTTGERRMLLFRKGPIS